MSDAYSSSAGAASAGVAASSKAVSDAWLNLSRGKVDKLHITHTTRFANFRFESSGGMIAGIYLCGSVGSGTQTAVLFIVSLESTATSLTTDGVYFVDLFGRQTQLISSIAYTYEPAMSTYRIKFDLASRGGATDIVLLSAGASNVTFYESQT